MMKIDGIKNEACRMEHRPAKERLTRHEVKEKPEWRSETKKKLTQIRYDERQKP